MDQGARQAAEFAARASYGRLLAILAARTRDISEAEDALAEAFASALQHWPQNGVPQKPEAWLLTAARNFSANRYRHERVRHAAQPELERIAMELSGHDERPFPDGRLELLFICAHPAIDKSLRAPLMLQTVLGLDAARIGAAFLMSPTSMSQRLVRVKAKIRDAGLRFEKPDVEKIKDRLPDVLDAIYAAYGTSWDEIGSDPAFEDLTREALFLARLIAHLAPDEPEALGLLSLLLHCEARRPARRDTSGAFVPLPEQNHHLWRKDMIEEAENLLMTAAKAAQFGRFQCEAAIQSVHAQRPITGTLNHKALLTLHDLLIYHAPSIGAHVGRAAVLLDMGEPHEALKALDTLAEERVENYQPYWVTRARTLDALAMKADAIHALEKALGLTKDPHVRAYLAKSPVR